MVAGIPVLSQYDDSACTYSQKVKDIIATKKKVLIVDDEQPLLRVLSIKMRVSGYEVVTATSGERALELVKSAHPDIMLLDIIMPGMDGLQVLEKLRPVCDMPVITFSARADNAGKALGLGSNDFLNKPFDVNDLVMRIKKILEERNGG